MLKKISNSLFRTENKIKLILTYFIIAIIAVLAFTFSRYAYKEIKAYFFHVKKFYFNCDKLTDDGRTIEMTNWSGVGSYSVKFNMNSYDNQLVRSEEDIEYDITYTCSSNVVCSVENNKTNGLIPSNTNVDDFTIVISVPPETILHNNDVVELNVKAKSTSPYEKELTGKFRLVVGNSGLSYEISDSRNAAYMNTRITNTLDYYVVREAFDSYSIGSQIDMDTYHSLSDSNKAKCASSIVTISFDPNVVLLDMTNSVYQRATNIGTTNIGGYSYVNSISFKIDAMSSELVKFYKKNVSVDYTYPGVSSWSIVSVTYS